MPEATATAWGGGVSFGGSTLDLRRYASVLFSLLGGVLRSRFLFLVGAPAPTLVCLLLPCPWGLADWRLACLPGSLAMSPGEPSALGLGHGFSGGARAMVPVSRSVPSGRASSSARFLFGLRCAGSTDRRGFIREHDIQNAKTARRHKLRGLRARRDPAGRGPGNGLTTHTRVHRG